MKFYAGDFYSNVIKIQVGYAGQKYWNFTWIPKSVLLFYVNLHKIILSKSWLDLPNNADM